MTKKFSGGNLNTITRFPVGRLVQVSTVDTVTQRGGGDGQQHDQLEVVTELKFRKDLEKFKGNLANDPLVKAMWDDQVHFCNLRLLTCFILACPEGDEVVGETVVGRVFMKVSAKKALQVPTGDVLRIDGPCRVLPVQSRIEVRAFCPKFDDEVNEG